MENIIKRNVLFNAERAVCILTTCAIFFAAFMLIRYPDSAAKGVTDGIELCLRTLIPSVFPFMFLSCFLLESGIIRSTCEVLDFIGMRFFGLPGCCVPVIFFSMIAGLPVGARLTEELYCKDMITKLQGQRMLFFCMNPGPAFVINVVGDKMLGSSELGVIIYLSLIVSSFLVGVLSVYVWSDGEKTENLCTVSTKADIALSVVRAVTQSSRNVFSICAWVVLFSCFIELIKVLGFSGNTENFLLAITEVTNGCKRCAEIYPAPIIAGIIGFGGLCAHMQVSSSIVSLRLEYKYFISARILNAGVSVLVSVFFLKCFPIAVETSAIGTVPEKAGLAMSYPICAGIMIMCFLLLLGDNFKLKKYKK